MSTLPIQAPRLPAVTLPSFARVIAAFTTVIDVYAEAQQLAAQAHKRYPFAAW